MKRLFRIFSVALLTMPLLLCSCSKADYVDAIPANSVALMYMDVQQAGANVHDGAIASLFGTDNANDVGIDFSSKIYAFETIEGNFGLCAKVSDADALRKCIDAQSKQGGWAGVTQRGDASFSCVAESWVVGFSDRALLVVGPVVAAAQPEVQRQMAKLLKQDEEKSIAHTPLFQKLDTMAAPMGLIAQCEALPEKFVAPFTLGVPKDASLSRVYLAAGMSLSDGCLNIDGNIFAFDKSLDEAIRKSASAFRPITDKYAKSVPASAMGAFFANVKGTDFLPMVQANKSLQPLLAGINTAIDMDNIIRCIDGDMLLTLHSVQGDKQWFSICAQQGGSTWLGDVDYWKQSCPSGTKIADWQPGAFCFSGSQTTFYFGQSADQQFYSGSTKDLALSCMRAADKPLPDNVRSRIVGRKLAIAVNLDAILRSGAVPQGVGAMLSSALGHAHTLLYSIY